MGWGFRYHIPYATALAMRGATEEAAAVLAALDEAWRPFRNLDYERSLARAWLVAGQGAITEAITTLLSAAETASTKGQFARRGGCACRPPSQFGNHSVATRLAETRGESIVEGPRVKLASRFAAALADSDALELEEISTGFRANGRPRRSRGRRRPCLHRIPPTAIGGAQHWDAPRGRRGAGATMRGASAHRRCERSANRCR